MALIRLQDGTWKLRIKANEWPQFRAESRAYLEALPRYLTALEPAFETAKNRNEFEFVHTWIRVRSTQDAGWDPYETSLDAIGRLHELQAEMGDFVARRHLQLWMYCHTVEASEPYEILANLLNVSCGRRVSWDCFTQKPGGPPPTPTQKIA